MVGCDFAFCNFEFGDLDLIVYFVSGVVTLIVVIPVGLWLIRALNETWLDPDWRAARREREQNRKYSTN